MRSFCSRCFAGAIATALVFSAHFAFAEEQSDPPTELATWFANKPSNDKAAHRDYETLTELSLYSRSVGSSGRMAAAPTTQGGWGEQFGMLFGLTFRQGLLSARAATDLALGGGANGPDGHIEVASLVGISVPVLPNMRVFLRAGPAAEYRANDVYLYSHLDLPLVELGAIYTQKYFVFQGGTMAAYTAAGRFDVTGSEHVLDRAPMMGGFAEMRAPDVPMFLRTELRSYDNGRAAGRVIEVRGRLCGTVSSIVMCGDMSSISGTMEIAGISTLQSGSVIYGGLSVGYGGSFSEHLK